MREPEFIPLRRFEAPARAAWLAPATILLGSLVTLLPFVAAFALLPPFGLLMLLGWRMQRPDVLKPWAPVLLGMFDDLVSGQPLGSAMLLWTLCIIAIDVLDTRLVWRDFWQDWLIATGAIGFCLIAGRLVATPFSAHVDTVLLLQIIISAALYPLIARFCARLDREKRT